MVNSYFKPRKLRSYVRRNGRFTLSQRNATVELSPQFCLTIDQGQLNYQQIFANSLPCYLEIGFGTGQSLLAVAKAHQDKNFIGIEMHKPGIGGLLLGMQQAGINNIRVFEADAVEVFEQCIPNESLQGVQIFFPDPWPKRRHHVRRLIQNSFVNLVASKLKTDAELHLATDWEDYAKHMLKVLTQADTFTNVFGIHQFAERSCYRPILTKFEKRALREGRPIWDLQFRK